jgi:hypothetical protein
LLRMIRARNEGVPIVVLSSRGDELGKVQALDLGADDYVTKPFGMDELLARMRTALRHQLQVHGERPIFRTGDLAVDLVRPGHGACWNATGHAAYSMVLSCLCGGFRSTRVSCRAGGQSAGRQVTAPSAVAAAACSSGCATVSRRELGRPSACRAQNRTARGARRRPRPFALPTRGGTIRRGDSSARRENRVGW